MRALKAGSVSHLRGRPVVDSRNDIASIFAFREPPGNPQVVGVDSDSEVALETAWRAGGLACAAFVLSQLSLEILSFLTFFLHRTIETSGFAIGQG